MADEAKKEFMEPEVTKSEKPLDDVTRGAQEIHDNVTYTI